MRALLVLDPTLVTRYKARGYEHAGAQHSLCPPRDQPVHFSGTMKFFPSLLSYLCYSLLGLLWTQEQE